MPTQKKGSEKIEPEVIEGWITGFLIGWESGETPSSDDDIYIAEQIALLREIIKQHRSPNIRLSKAST